MVKTEDSPVSHVYLRSAQHGWVPALQVKVDGNKANVCRPVFKSEKDLMSCPKKQKLAPNELVDLRDYPNQCLPMQNVDANGHLEDYKDMVQLPFMHEVGRG